MTMHLTVDLVDLTFGDLYDFVDAARGSGVPADQTVEQVPVPQDDSIIDYFRVELAGPVGQSVTLTSEERAEFVGALGRVIDSDGDGRAVLKELQRLRDRLLGAPDSAS